MQGAGEDNRNRGRDRQRHQGPGDGSAVFFVVVLSQMSRKADETYHAPTMTYLRDSGAIEAAADQIALLFTDHAHPMSPKDDNFPRLFAAGNRCPPQRADRPCPVELCRAVPAGWRLGSGLFPCGTPSNFREACPHDHPLPHPGQPWAKDANAHRQGRRTCRMFTPAKQSATKAPLPYSPPRTACRAPAAAYRPGEPADARGLCSSRRAGP